MAKTSTIAPALSDQQLLDHARTFRDALEQAAVWPNSRDPFTMSANSGLYELYVAIRLIDAMHRSHTVEYVPGHGDTAHSFPRGPAAKRGRPYFRLHVAGKTFQLCLGTKIADRHGHERAPDISLQQGSASDTPTHNDVLNAWDAKYRELPHNDERLTHDEVALFRMWRELLQLEADLPDGLLLTGLEELRGNVLVTNGQHSTNRIALLEESLIRECERFYPGASHRARP